MSPRAGLDRARVAEAAVQIADAEGLDAVTIARVAAALGVKGPSLYNHVASRDALLREVALRAIGELADALALAAAGRSGEEALIAAGTAYRAYAAAYPGRYAAGLRARGGQDEEIERAGERVLEVFHAALRGFDLSGDDLVHAVRALRSALHGFVVLEASGGFAYPVEVDVSYDAMIEMLVAGIAQQGR